MGRPPWVPFATEYVPAYLGAGCQRERPFESLIGISPYISSCQSSAKPVIVKLCSVPHEAEADAEAEAEIEAEEAAQKDFVPSFVEGISARAAIDMKDSYELSVPAKRAGAAFEALC